jgi:hypothetical protein
MPEAPRHDIHRRASPAGTQPGRGGASAGPEHLLHDGYIAHPAERTGA